MLIAVISNKLESNSLESNPKDFFFSTIEVENVISHVSWILTFHKGNHALI